MLRLRWALGLFWQIECTVEWQARIRFAGMDARPEAGVGSFRRIDRWTAVVRALGFAWQSRGG